MSVLKLRAYQEDALTQIKDYYKIGIKKVALVLPTGSGKTLCFCKILNSVYRNGKSGILVVKGVELVDNASQRLLQENVSHGVIQASHWNNRPHERLQVCSIDTLVRRKNQPKADIVIIDEAHMATSESYKWLAEQYPNAYFLSVTATPNVKSGLKHIAEVAVSPIGINDLIRDGFLCPPKYFSPSKIDVSGLKIDSKTGDYVTRQLETAMDKVSIYGDLVKNYQKRGDSRKVLIFAVSVAHSKKIKEYFNKAGIPCDHIDAITPKKDREKIIARLESGELKAITNVGVLATGVDIPCIEAIIFARPTKSYNLWIQMCGRGTRLYPGKKNFYVFDHVGNVAEHGFIEDEREILLDGWKDTTETVSVSSCSKCFATFSTKANYKKILKDDFEGDENKLRDHYNFLYSKLKRGDRAYNTKLLYFCPECDHDNTPKVDPVKKKSEKTDDILRELSEEEKFDLTVKTRLKELKLVAKSKKYKRGWVYFQLKNEFGEETASRFYKKRVVPDWVRKKIES